MKSKFKVYFWGSLLLVFAVLLLSSSISALIIPDHFIEPPLELDDPAINKVRTMVRLISLPFLGLGLWMFFKLRLKIFYLIALVLIPLLTIFYIFVVVK
ncbi:hypothetical protein IBX65_09320 [Candidatus Aerophobetes bacterium]|nr:hypothetical protein [Candidatus Aerophobetes bacterium]